MGRKTHCESCLSQGRLLNVYNLEKSQLRANLAQVGINYTKCDRLFEFQALWAISVIGANHLIGRSNFWSKVCEWVRMKKWQLVLSLEEKTLNASGKKWDHIEVLLRHEIKPHIFVLRPRNVADSTSRLEITQDVTNEAEVAVVARLTRAIDAAAAEAIAEAAAAEACLLARKEEQKRKQAIQKERLAKIAADEKKALEVAEARRKREVEKAQAERLAKIAADEAAKLAEAEAEAEAEALREIEAATKKAARRKARQRDLTDLRRRLSDDDQLALFDFVLLTLRCYVEDTTDFSRLLGRAQDIPKDPRYAIASLDAHTMTSFHGTLQNPLSQDYKTLLWINSAYGDMFVPATGSLRIKRVPDAYKQYILAKPIALYQQKFERRMAQHIPGASTVLYHGTNLSNLQSILHTGFRTCDYNWVMGNEYIGIYMSSSAYTSVAYAQQKSNRNVDYKGTLNETKTHGVLLVCEVAGNRQPLADATKPHHVIKDKYDIMIRYVFLVPYDLPRIETRQSADLDAELAIAFKAIRHRQLKGDWHREDEVL